MAVTDRIIKENIHIQYDEEGLIKGAHVSRRRVIEDDGVILNVSLLPAEPLDLSVLSDFMTEVQIEALARITSLALRIAELEAQLLDSPED